MLEITHQQHQKISETLSINGNLDISRIAGDGGNRSYHRLMQPSTGKSDIIMQLDAQDQALLAENKYNWTHLARELSSYQIRTPKIKSILAQEGFIIIEDFGNLTLEEKVRSLPKPFKLEVYAKPLECWRKMVSIKPSKHSKWVFHSFDENKLFYELGFLLNHLLSPLNLISKGEEITFLEEAKSLAATVASHSSVFVHRDFHSRNLMVLKNNEIGVIDFQDARIGPASYDLVSLCFDAYVDLDIDDRLELMDKGMQLVDGLSSEWIPTLLQRQLKALGSFGYLALQKGKINFLKYLQPASSILFELSDRFHQWPFLSQTIVPRVVQYSKGNLHA